MKERISITGEGSTATSNDLSLKDLASLLHQHHGRTHLPQHVAQLGGSHRGAANDLVFLPPSHTNVSKSVTAGK